MFPPSTPRLYPPPPYITSLYPLPQYTLSQYVPSFYSLSVPTSFFVPPPYSSLFLYHHCPCPSLCPHPEHSHMTLKLCVNWLQISEKAIPRSVAKQFLVAGQRKVNSLPTEPGTRFEFDQNQTNPRTCCLLSNHPPVFYRRRRTDNNCLKKLPPKINC